ncbi:MAG: hypothetical protein AVDCRST_MAG62-1271 [uncultured Sphingomonas sp.]|uniref:Uncharacterized protein n=1 Tax=uncultured Sphingomonas sp. TaxID=158754 RepID=A0A6J4TIN1_9SPHN|nr:MAG: hypothetical protein AVDCRST_MAG62-1271 [uncultured Sphingomonas sp.]
MDNKNQGGGDKPASPLPPIANPVVEGAKPRRNYILPWALLGLALLALILFLTQGGRDGEELRQDAIARDQAGQSEAVGPGAVNNTADD